MKRYRSYDVEGHDKVAEIKLICVFCGNNMNLKEFKGKSICRKCIQDAK